MKKYIVFAAIMAVMAGQAAMSSPTRDDLRRRAALDPSLPSAESTKNAKWIEKAKEPEKKIPVVTAVALDGEPKTLKPKTPEPLRIMGVPPGVVDKEEKIIWRSDDKRSISEIASSPSGKKFLIHRGNGEYEIRLIEHPQNITKLPEISDSNPHMEALSPWFWVDESTLLGQTAISLDRKDLKLAYASDLEDTLPVRTLLFLYNIETGKLTQLVIPDKIPAVFNVVEVNGRYVKLESDADTPDSKIHWLEIPLQK